MHRLSRYNSQTQLTEYMCVCTCVCAGEAEWGSVSTGPQRRTHRGTRHNHCTKSRLGKKGLFACWLFSFYREVISVVTIFKCKCSGNLQYNALSWVPPLSLLWQFDWPISGAIYCWTKAFAMVLDFSRGTQKIKVLFEIRITALFEKRKL